MPRRWRIHSSSSRAWPSDRTIRESRRCVTCSRVLPRGRSGINVSNWRIEALACARVAHVLQRAADSGLPAGHSSCSSLSRPRLSRPRSPFFFFAERRGRAIVSSSKSSRTREEGPGSGPRHQLCAHANYSSTVQPCIHMVVHHYPHDTSPLSRKQTHCACFRVHSTCLSHAAVFPKNGWLFNDRWNMLLQSCLRTWASSLYWISCFTLMTDFLVSLELKFT